MFSKDRLSNENKLAKKTYIRTKGVIFMEKKKMSRDESSFIFDERNILNCGKCPYNIGVENCDDPDRVYPCNQTFCWIEIACDDETYRN